MTAPTPVGYSDTDTDPRWALLKQKANEAKAVEAFRLFRSARIEPILIKGLAAALYYPEGHFRDSVDLDLAVAPEDFEKGDELVRSADAKGLAIDLHRGLRHLDIVPWNDLFLNTRTLDLERGCVRIPRPEDHLRILCVHWLTDGGANESRLLDIYYAIENRPLDFDWSRFLDVVDEKRRRWLVCTVDLARQTYGLDLAGTPLATGGRPAARWFVDTVNREWHDETPFRPLPDSMDGWKTFWRQLRKRLPPNPITATILMNGSVDVSTPFFYQIGTVLRRVGPSTRSIIRELIARLGTGARPE